MIASSYNFLLTVNSIFQLIVMLFFSLKTASVDFHLCVLTSSFGVWLQVASLSLETSCVAVKVVGSCLL